VYPGEGGRGGTPRAVRVEEFAYGRHELGPMSGYTQRGKEPVRPFDPEAVPDKIYDGKIHIEKAILRGPINPLEIGEGLLEEGRLPVAMKECLEVFFPPAWLRKAADLVDPLKTLTLPEDRNPKPDLSPRPFDPVSCEPGEPARELHRVEEDEAVGMDGLVKESGPGEKDGLVDGDAHFLIRSPKEGRSAPKERALVPSTR